MAEITSTPSYELSALRLAPLAVATFSAAIAEKSDIIPFQHTTNSLVLASGVAAMTTIQHGMGVGFQSGRGPEISQASRRRAAGLIAVGAAAVATTLNPEIRQRPFTSHEAGVVALDALSGGVLAGALTLAMWRKRRNTGKP